MSRWDALKSETSNNNRSDRNGSNNYNGLREDPKSTTIGYNRRRLPPPNRLNNDGTTINASQATEQYRRLINDISLIGCSKTRDNQIQQLASLLLLNYECIKPEELAHDCVSSIFLPYLNNIVNDRNAMTAVAIFKTLLALFSNPQYSSALLARLVVKINCDSGVEQTTENPICTSLITTCQQVIAEQCHRREGLRLSSVKQQAHYAALCLCAALKALHKIEGVQTSSNKEVDAIILYQYVNCCLINSSECEYTFELVFATLRRQPKSAATFVSQLHVTPDYCKPQATTTNRNRCDMCQIVDHQLSPILSYFHTTKDVYNTAWECLTELLLHAPYSLWLSQQKNANRYTNFQQNIVSTLTSILKIIACRLKRPSTIFNRILSRLLQIVWTKLPYDEVALLTEPACELIEISLSHDVSNRTSHLTNSIVQALGGYETPQGSIEAMSTPWYIYFTTKRAGKELLRLALIDDSCNNFIFDLITRALASNACVLLENRELCANWANRLCDIVSSNCSYDLMIGSITMITSFLQGRSNVDFLHGELYGKTIKAVLEVLIFAVDKNTQHADVCKAIGLLSTQDWSLVVIDDRKATKLLDYLLTIVTNGNMMSKNLRLESYKSLSNIATSFVLKHDDSGELHRYFWTKLFSVFVDARSITDIDLQGLCILGMGNLLQTLNYLRECHSEDVVNYSELLDFFTQFLESEDSKLVSNSLRGIGHLGAVLVGSQLSCSTYKEVVETLTFLLQKRVDTAILYGDVQYVQKISWKERSRIRKHGWNACNALSSIFASFDDVNSPLLRSLSEVVETLLKCICNHAKLNEKLVVSASSALCSLSTRVFSRILQQCVFMIPEVVSCVNLVCITEDAKHRPKLEKSMQLLQIHILQSLNTAGALLLLQNEDACSASLLLDLYHFMVDNKMKAETFATFVLAMQNANVPAHIELLYSQQALSLLPISSNEQDEL